MSQAQEIAADSIDKVTTPEIRVQSENLPSGVIDEMYQAARTAMGQPLSLSAAQALQETVDDGDTVMIATGAGSIPWMPKGETDGPLGAVGLANGLSLALGARPVLLTEERHIPPLKAAAHACGLNNVPYDQLTQRKNAVTIESYPETRMEAEKAAEHILEEKNPTTVVAIEKLGPNDEGVIHSITGQERPEGYARVDALFDRAHEREILTVGIGDGGNEIGFGAIQDTVQEIQPYGAECVCPCGGGVATRVEADHVVVGGTSNWGAYGVEAMLGLLTETPEALHSADDETRMLEHSILKGAGDGLHGRPMVMVDGTTEATNRGIVAILNNIVNNRLTSIDRPF